MRPPTLKQRLDKPTLVKLYEFNGLSTATIAERFGTGSAQILKLLVEYEIPRRPRGA
jgi:hypothetical protein